MTDTVTLSKNQLLEIVREAIRQERDQANAEKIYSIYEAARILGKAYNTVCRMIESRRIETTADGKFISQKAINEYLTAR